MDVLIVDDSILANHALKGYFTKLGHNVVGIAKDGQQGMDLFSTHKPQIVTVDAIMPGNISGVDFIKYDDIVPHPDEVKAVAKAIAKTQKPIILSLSPGNTVDSDAIAFFRMANMLRITYDIWDEQKDIDACFSAWRKWHGKEQPGFWIDMDMIPFGQLQLMSPPSEDDSKTPMDKGDIALAGKGVNRWSQLSRTQMRTFITMRAMAASPLMVGGDLPTLDDFSLSLLTNSEMVACNQNGVMGSLIYEKDGIEIWKVEKKDSAGEGWIGIFNRNDNETSFNPTKNMFKLDDFSYTFFNIWNNKPSKIEKLELEPHSCVFLHYNRE